MQDSIQEDLELQKGLKDLLAYGVLGGGVEKMKEEKKLRSIRIEDSKIFLLQEILGEDFNFNGFVRSQIDSFLSSKKKRVFKQILAEEKGEGEWRRVSVNFSEKEKALLKEATRESQLSLSQEIRRRVLSTFKTSVLLSGSDREELVKVNYKLAKIGTNMNQIARFFNSASAQKGMVKINSKQGESIEGNLKTLGRVLEETKEMFTQFLEKSI